MTSTSVSAMCGPCLVPADVNQKHPASHSRPPVLSGEAARSGLTFDISFGWRYAADCRDGGTEQSGTGGQWQDPYALNLRVRSTT